MAGTIKVGTFLPGNKYMYPLYGKAIFVHTDRW